MTLKDDFCVFWDQHEALKAEVARLQAENGRYRRLLADQEAVFANRALELKEQYRRQHRQYVREYQVKIRDLQAHNRRLRAKEAAKEATKEAEAEGVLEKEAEREAEKENVPERPEKGKCGSQALREIAAPKIAAPKIAAPKIAAPMIPGPRAHGVPAGPISSSPVKGSELDMLPTQYSTDSDSPPKATPAPAPATPALDLAPPLAEATPALATPALAPPALTPLQQRDARQRYYTDKFFDEPAFRIDLRTNPITATCWTLNDFKDVDPVLDTPPYLWIKDNTSQEDQIKRAAHEALRSAQIDRCLQQCMRGANRFRYAILNKYVRAGRVSNE